MKRFLFIWLVLILEVCVLLDMWLYTAAVKLVIRYDLNRSRTCRRLIDLARFCVESDMKLLKSISNPYAIY